MPRKRKIEDADLLAAARRELGRVGPARITVDGVAREAGLAKATVLQRFGSKRGLMMALARQGTRQLKERFAAATRTAGPAISRLIDLLVTRAGPIEDPTHLAHQLAFLPIALGDAGFRKLAEEQARCARKGIRELLASAVDGGELMPGDIDELTTLIYVTYTGSLFTWAVLREGAVGDWLRSNVVAVLRPHLVARRSGRRSARK
jgi:AcrR family transcriptional regulator